MVRAKFPDLYHWVNYCYGKHSAVLWVGNRRFRSVTGVQQGGPLGPLLFAIALQEPLLKLDQHLRSTFPEEDVALLSFYMDDGVIIANNPALVEALDFLNSAYVKGFGVHLYPAKCEE